MQGDFESWNRRPPRGGADRAADPRRHRGALLARRIPGQAEFDGRLNERQATWRLGDAQALFELRSSRTLTPSFSDGTSHGYHCEASSRPQLEATTCMPLRSRAEHPVLWRTSGPGRTAHQHRLARQPFGTSGQSWRSPAPRLDQWHMPGPDCSAHWHSLVSRLSDTTERLLRNFVARRARPHT